MKIEKQGPASRMLSFLALLLVALSLNGCAHADPSLTSIPLPAATNKLRVAVYPVSGQAKWQMPHERYAEAQYRTTARFLDRMGIYEVVPLADVQAVLGREWLPGWVLQKGSWTLARQAAKSLHADYILVAERSKPAGSAYYWQMALINAENGRTFSSTVLMPGGPNPDYSAAMRATYGEIFKTAKADMLANALRKGRRLQQPQGVEDREEAAPAVKKADNGVKSAPPIPVSTAGTAEERPSDPIKTFPKEETTTGKTRMVVHDLAASPHLRIVALILSEALREELFLLGRFTLLNRDNINQVMEELKLQQTALVDEKSAVRIGKWLAVRESVTGRLETLGNQYVLYARRTDIESLDTLGAGSVKCTLGDEERLLKEIATLARKLAH